MWVTKIDRTRAFANQAYLEFLGVPYEEGLAFDWRTILHPDDVQRIVKESIAGEATLKPFVLEGRYRRADGQWRWMRSESQPRWDPTGKHIGFIGVAHDVTVAKEAEFELRESERNAGAAYRGTHRAASVQRSANARDLRNQQPVPGAAGSAGQRSLRQCDGAGRNPGQHMGRRRKAILGFAVVFRDGGNARNRDGGFRGGGARRKRAEGNAAQPSRRRTLFRFHHAPGVRSARRRLRGLARSRRHHRAAAGRGGAASVPEDGCDRPADRRRRPRFQQPAHHHPLRDRFPASPRTAARTGAAVTSMRFRTRSIARRS